MLRVRLTREQAAILLALLEPPYRVLARSAHSVGKTFLAAVAVNWWYDCHDPGVAITTAPTERDVIDLLWTEVRLQRGRARLGGFVGPRAPEMRTSEEHYAKGYTSRKGESFQGRHRRRMLFVYEEAEGIEANYFTTLETMFKPEAGHAALVIYNPTTTTAPTFAEERKLGPDGKPKWRQFTLSALDHPNIAAELAGRRAPIPGAVSLAQLRQWIKDWCERIAAPEARATDFEFPPGSGEWHRPGPIGEPRILGRRPTQGVNAVWNEGLWDLVKRTLHHLSDEWPVQIGCDVATYGDDLTSMHIRKGLCSLRHESHGGWSTVQTAGRLKQLAHEFAGKADPKGVPILIDVAGPGVGVVDQADGYNFVGVNSAWAARSPERFPNVRSELWCDLVQMAVANLIDLSRLPEAVREVLWLQLSAPTFRLDAAGRIVVEPKDLTKKRLKRSPDDADAFNLAYYPLS